jgi:hypothetical protein
MMMMMMMMMAVVLLLFEWVETNSSQKGKFRAWYTLDLVQVLPLVLVLILMPVLTLVLVKKSYDRG